MWPLEDSMTYNILVWSAASLQNKCDKSLDRAASNKKDDLQDNLHRSEYGPSKSFLRNRYSWVRMWMLPCVRPHLCHSNTTHASLLAHTYKYKNNAPITVFTALAQKVEDWSALWSHSSWVWCQKPCNCHWIVTWHECGQGGKFSCTIGNKHGWATYLVCSVGLCKHTSGWSAKKSRLYCPLTSAELLILNPMQGRVSTVDLGSPSFISQGLTVTHSYGTHETHSHANTTWPSTMRSAKLV